MTQNGYTPQIITIGVPDVFVEHGTTPELYKKYSMDNDAVLQAILKYKKQ